VSASDTITQAQLGSRGAYLVIINGNASPDVMSITDYSATDAGNNLPSNTYAATVANATSQVFFIKPQQVNPATGLVTVTHTVTATVTYQLFPVSI
jgi:hypothetical protein